MEAEKKVNIYEINKIHFVHYYLDKGWQVHIQKPKKENIGVYPHHSKNRLVLRNVGDGNDTHRKTKRIILSDDVAVHSIGNGYGGKNTLDEDWLKENKRIVCIYTFLHNTLRKGWIIHKQKNGNTDTQQSSTYCFSKPHKNQVKYLSQDYLQKFITDNVYDDLEACFA